MAKKTLKREILRHCDEIGPEDGIDPCELLRRITTNKQDRKALQLCRQVERTVSLVASGELNDDRIRDLQLISVVPAPHSNHLLVTFQASEILSGKELLKLDALLASHRGHIRSAIAVDINRKKTPDITLRVVNPPSSGC